jgi:prepilin-type N-terminal cleavage/methylation domain-containing protein
MHMKKREYSQTGFSLVELLIVLCAGCILTAIAVPGLTGMWSNYNTVFAAQEICSQLHFAKVRAISSNEALRLTFPNANTYKIDLSDGTTLRGPYALPTGASLNTTDTDNPVTFPGDYVTFRTNGTLPASGNGSAGRIKLISRNGLRVDIVVDSGGMIRQTPSYKTSTPPF